MTLGKKETDIIVIGSGVGGLIAGLTALEHGHEVQIISKGKGASIMSAGVIDVCGYYPKGDLCLEPMKGIKAWGKDSRHLFNNLGLGKNINAGLDFFKKQVATGGLSYVGNTEKNMLLPTILGTIKPTCLAPYTAADGDLGNIEGRVGLVGFKHFPEFSPSLATASLKEQFSLTDTYNPGKNVNWEPITLDLAEVSKRPYASPMEVAEMFDRQEVFEILLDKLSCLLKEDRWDCIGLPPVMGFLRAEENIRNLKSELAMPVFELLPLSPSIPGFRLLHSLEECYHLKSGRRSEQNFSVISLKSRNGKIELTGLFRGKEHKLVANCCILATGGYIGGGLQPGSGKIMVSVLEHILEISPDGLFQEQFFPADGHRALGMGLGVNNNLQPLDSDGGLLLPNLFAAGDVLGGYDFVRELSGFGVAIVSGFLAGENASIILEQGDGSV